MAIDLIVEARLWSQYITQCLAIISKKKCVFTHTYACAHKHTLLRTQAHIHTHTHTRTHTHAYTLMNWKLDTAGPTALGNRWRRGGFLAVI